MACFFVTNHVFVERRLGRSTNIDNALAQLITQVFKENEVDPANPNLHFLKQAVQTLDEQAGFESGPDLIQHHQDVVGAIFDRIQEMTDLLTRHNYDSFVPEKFEPWMSFDSSPKTGEIAPDFPLWQLDETEMRLAK